MPFTLSGYNQVLASKVALYFIAILGLNILTGYTGQISIGHGAFMAIGGYTTAIMSQDHHTNLIATIPLAFAIAFVWGVALGLPASRLSGVYLALATLAFAVSIPQLILKFSHFTGARNGIQVNGTVGYLWLYGVSWACAAVMFALAWLVLRGRTGRAFRAVRDSEVAAASSGVSLVVYKTLAFGVSAGLRRRGRIAVRAGDERLRPAGRVLGRPVAVPPDRRRRRRARLALGRDRRRGVRRAAPEHLLERAA